MHAAQEVCENAHAIAILTEWDEFKELDWKAVYEDMLKPAFLFDGRRLLNKADLENVGFEVFVIGS